MEEPKKKNSGTGERVKVEVEQPPLPFSWRRLLHLQVEPLAQSIVAEWPNNGPVQALKPQLIAQARELAGIIDSALLTGNGELLPIMLNSIKDRTEAEMAAMLSHVEKALEWDAEAHSAGETHYGAVLYLRTELARLRPAFAKLTERDIERVLKHRGKRKAAGVAVQINSLCLGFGSGRISERSFTKAREKMRKKKSDL